jgi:hypothetical protein
VAVPKEKVGASTVYSGFGVVAAEFTHKSGSPSERVLLLDEVLPPGRVCAYKVRAEFTLQFSDSLSEKQ